MTGYVTYDSVQGRRGAERRHVDAIEFQFRRVVVAASRRTGEDCPIRGEWISPAKINVSIDNVRRL